MSALRWRGGGGGHIFCPPVASGYCDLRASRRLGAYPRLCLPETWDRRGAAKHQRPAPPSSSSSSLPIRSSPKTSFSSSAPTAADKRLHSEALPHWSACRSLSVPPIPEHQAPLSQPQQLDLLTLADLVRPPVADSPKACTTGMSHLAPTPGATQQAPIESWGEKTFQLVRKITSVGRVRMPHLSAGNSKLVAKSKCAPRA
ncbi:hypothetical protein LZ30DRAFT_686746 [Colletotrichum cereale]|nr:hypothetical protein LZ30DRAFT_686746 [Colletotrichum cereale]